MPLSFDVTLVFREIPRAHVETKLNPNKGSPAGAENCGSLCRPSLTHAPGSMGV